MIKLFSMFKRGFSSLTAKVTALSVFLFANVASAAAENTTDAMVTSAFNDLKIQAISMAGKAFPVMVAIIGIMLTIKLFKRFTSKAV